MKLIFLVFIFIFPAGNLWWKTEVQSNEDEANNIVYEKVYLHVDRELYTPGESVWFKAYLVSGINHQLIPGYKNVYVQLIAEDGSIVDQKLLLSDYGTASGDMQLSSTLSEGKYTIRAYTQYLQNFGPESYFHKKILVSPAENLLAIAERLDKEGDSSVDVAFLPESGTLVLNTVNHIAFKAIDSSGKGVSVKGKIVDETGREVVVFRDSYKGMGRFIIMPEDGKSYFALLDGYPEFSYAFEPAVERGVSLNYKAEGNYLLFTMSRNIKNYRPEEFLLVASHKGMELFRSQIRMEEFQHAIRLYKGLFPLGISKISLYETDGAIRAERLVFVRNENDRKIEIRSDKPAYRKREKVEIELSSLLPEPDTILSSVSVAVVDENYFSSGGNSQTIESYLLLDSELKGSIEAPASAFMDEPAISASEKLDLIMMINGWRSYYWNDLEQYAGKELPGWADIGLTLTGNVTRLLTGKPVEDGKVILGPFSREFLMEETTTDQQGNFSFDNLYLKDDAVVMINAETERGNRRNTIALEQPLLFDTLISADQLQSATYDIEATMSFYSDVYYSRESEQEFEVEQGSILLDQIEITGEKEMPSDGHFRLYGEPDHSFDLTDDDYTYANILDYLEAKVPGVTVTGDQIRIRAGYGNPLLLVDGLEVEWDYVMYLPIGDIDKLEILKSSANMAIYGSSGGNGVISIFTKMGYGQFDHRYVRNVPGRITPQITGFQQPRKFYSPQYSLNNINDPMPDFRPTLYWNPAVLLQDGEARVEFFTSDNASRFQIVVEGISKNGKIIYGTGVMNVAL